MHTQNTPHGQPLDLNPQPPALLENGIWEQSLRGSLSALACWGRNGDPGRPRNIVSGHSSSSWAGKALVLLMGLVFNVWLPKIQLPHPVPGSQNKTGNLESFTKACILFFMLLQKYYYINVSLHRFCYVIFDYYIAKSIYRCLNMHIYIYSIC